MKKLIFAFLTCIVLFGCKSKEDKVADLIKDEMFKTLYDFESYEPIETKIDSAFKSIYMDSMILHHAYIAKINIDECNASLEKANEAKETMEIWSDSYSSMGVSRHEKAEGIYTEQIREACLCMLTIIEKMDTIKNLSLDFSTEFMGWKATHKFRCKTKGGNFNIGNYMYVFDKSINQIIHTEDLDEKEIRKLKDIIKTPERFKNIIREILITGNYTPFSF